jgi:DNA-binding GntR family transcriptional regulator
MAAICLSNRPLYLQVRDAVAERIATGTWKTGNAIPNEGDLAREFGVSVGTVRKALGLLEGQHILTRQQGRGTFVNDPRQPPIVSRLFVASMANRSPMRSSPPRSAKAWRESRHPIAWGWRRKIRSIASVASGSDEISHSWSRR